MVPKKGLEPPHPCEYMDLNHARLPIPPLRLEDIRPPEHSSDGEAHESRPMGCIDIVAAA